MNRRRRRVTRPSLPPSRQGNALIPATSAFPDERCHALLARRAITLLQHHITPLGLNVMRWPNPPCAPADDDALAEVWPRDGA